MRVGAPRRTVHPPLVDGQRRTDLLARFGVPDPDRAVATRGKDTTPIWAPRHTGDSVSVADQCCTDLLAGFNIPNPHRLVVAAGNNSAPVRTERHTDDPAGLASNLHPIPPRVHAFEKSPFACNPAFQLAARMPIQTQQHTPPPAHSHS